MAQLERHIEAVYLSGSQAVRGDDSAANIPRDSLTYARKEVEGPAALPQKLAH